MDYSFMVVDTETTNLHIINSDIIELSIYKLSINTEIAQKTWCLKPLNPEYIDPAALRINGHKLEDLLHQTKDGRERYIDANKVIIEVENWLAEDNLPAENRMLIGHNCAFDKDRLEQLWIKCNSKDSFPFSIRYMDTMIFEIMIDYAKEQFAEGYSLKNLTKKYGVKNEKTHSAASDTLAAKEVFEKQIEYLRNLLKNK